MPGARQVAVSYDTSTFNDLVHYLPGIERITPDDLFVRADAACSYINLICLDLSLRRAVSQFLDEQHLSRFSYIHPSVVTTGATVLPGAVMYPGVILYPGVEIGMDSLIHANTAIGHRSHIGQGAYISGGVTVGGRTTLGDWCMLGLGCSLYDNITITDSVIIGAGSIVRKSITEPGTYSSAAAHRLKRLK